MSFSKIQIQSSKLKKSGFDFSKKHFASARWGEVSPSLVKTIATPDQSLTWNSSKLTRLAPLVSPAYGHCVLKEYFQFVPWRVIFKGCEHFLSQVERRPDSDRLMQRVDQLPMVSTDLFMYYLCSKGNCHLFTWGRQGSDVVSNQWKLLTGGYSQAYSSIFPSIPSNSTEFVPLNDFPAENSGWATSQYQFTPDVADYVCTAYSSSIQYDVKLAIKLTQKGSRFQKFILGCGLPLTFEPNIKFSALKLFAVYKAYFDIFALPQYDNWEETFCYRLIRYYDTNNPLPINDATFANLENTPALKSLWFGFFDEICQMYYTANADNISSQLPTDWNINAPELEKLNGMIELNGISEVSGTSSNGPGLTSGATILNWNDGGNNLNPVGEMQSINVSPGTQLFSQFTDEFIKKAYYWCQKKTNIGNKISDLLRAKGMGGYVDLLDSGFLGKCETNMTISEVISTADTNLRSLGDYAGQSSNYKESSSFHLHNDEVGVLVGLYVVVPDDAHLVNSPDMAEMCTTPQTFYNPILDGLGYSPLARLGVGHQEANYHQNGSGNLMRTFGLQPRFQEFKVNNDTMVGNFALRSQRDSYDPFHMQKLIVTHENEVLPTSTISAAGEFTDNSVVAANLETFPNAGESWRYPCRYDFIGNYDRIFQEDNGIPVRFFDTFDNNFPVDNFMLFFEFGFKSVAPMLSISKSFETIECENEDNNTFNVTR